MNLLDSLKSWIKVNGQALRSCTIDQSPCTECSKVLRERTWEIASLLGGGSGHFEFSFVYSKVYATGEGDNERIACSIQKENASDGSL